MKGPSVSVILPTYNESKNIKEVIDQVLHYLGKNSEIIVVDDNSPDRTWEIVKGIKDKRIKLIRRYERGLASALSLGIKEAKSDVVVWMDADMSMPPSLIPRLLDELKVYDIAIGSRYVKGGKDARGFTRVLTSWLMNFFAFIVLNYNIRDYDSGFVASKKRVFEKVKLYTAGYGEYCIRFLYEAAKVGFKVKEVPYTFTERKKGKSKTSEHWWSMLRHAWFYGTTVLRLRFR